ncbi:hypothetical protein NAEGRDRAFT_82122 [Naegleria gruberi]|uniref:Uncharacterized protein n=1 Tax=Naegleria gruberi TaxID=5762 RepID=D2W2A5_NAEGR|nr:uncharacterized protein NAEGRDRAFT_82122 [Naegleria gruberi]EFC36791.1 hypothetical protein NAEGRDRAFT_82122 [Naegleria gruberi]|eukprot:XP_002669535.1 hypothetical protein NAEGRDRAFT_82122 [Naegleria gruberi strain NEG-M]
MKRQFESIEDSSSDSSSYESSTTPTTNASSSSTTIRNNSNNRSRRYIDNIVHPQPSSTTTPSPQLHNNNSNRNNITITSQQDSYPFVTSSTKVPTNRRHLKLRKQLKTCSNFSSSYFVLDVNAPAANTIGFMGSTRGNDIPVLLTDTVSNSNQSVNHFLPSSSNTPNTPCKKKTKRAQTGSINFVSNNKKGTNKKWIASVNTTVSSSSSSPTNPLNTTTTTTTTTTNSTQPTAEQSFLQQLINPMSSMIRPNTNNVLVQNVLPIGQIQPTQNNHSHNHLVSSMNPFQHQQHNMNTIQSMLHPLSNNIYQSNVQNTAPQNHIFPSLDTILNCYANPLLNSPPLGQMTNYSNNSLDSSPITTTPSTPSNTTNNNGIASPIFGSLINMPQVNSLTSGSSTGNSFGMPNQNYNMVNYNSAASNSEMVNHNQQITLEDLLTHDEARILLNTVSSYFNQQNNQF